MTHSEIRVVGALLILVLVLLLIFSFGYAFSGEENTRSSEMEKHVPVVFVNGLFDEEIQKVSERYVHTNTCGHPNTFITYHKEKAKEETIYLDGLYYEPCDCEPTHLFIRHHEQEPIVRTQRLRGINYVPTCGTCH